MNEQNYGSLEACKRLAEAGIVIETDFVWVPFSDGGGWDIVFRPWAKSPEIPAPSMAEVWRELPRYIKVKGYHYEKLLTAEPDGFTCAHYSDLQRNYTIFRGDSQNPTDALIDLLIWVRKQS